MLKLIRNYELLVNNYHLFPSNLLNESQIEDWLRRILIWQANFQFHEHLFKKNIKVRELNQCKAVGFKKMSTYPIVLFLKTFTNGSNNYYYRRSHGV